jgi:hypothetical protein
MLHLVIYFSSLVGRKVPKEGHPAKSLSFAAGVFFRNSGSRVTRYKAPEFQSENTCRSGLFEGGDRDFTNKPVPIGMGQDCQCKKYRDNS